MLLFSGLLLAEEIFHQPQDAVSRKESAITPPAQWASC